MINNNKQIKSAADKPATYTSQLALASLDGGVGGSRPTAKFRTVPHTFSPQSLSSKLDVAVALIQKALASGPMNSVALSRLLIDHGISSATSDRARKRAGVVAKKVDGNRFTCWLDPAAAMPAPAKKPKRSPSSSKQRHFDDYRQSARIRQIRFALTAEQFSALTSGDCYYCGVKPEIDRQGIFVNGIDRVDSSVGYSADNCVPCCTICNMAKRDMPVAVFTDWLTRVTRHMNRPALIASEVPA